MAYKTYFIRMFRMQDGSLCVDDVFQNIPSYAEAFALVQAISASSPPKTQEIINAREKIQKQVNVGEEVELNIYEAFASHIAILRPNRKGSMTYVPRPTK